MSSDYVISKILSSNDTGETGSHQVGILIPKKPQILDFFPALDPKQKNPRVNLSFLDEHQVEWNFAFIYYNGLFFGGTRNEYRLTKMTSYIRSCNLKAGDEVILLKNDTGYRYVSYKRKPVIKVDQGYALILGRGWKIINY